jgi:hypothetical protein
MKPFFRTLFLSAALFTTLLPSKAAQPQALSGQPRLKVFVGEVKGDEDVSQSIRTRLVDELARRGVALVASQEQADVTLKGIGVHRTARRFMIRGQATVSVVIRGDVLLFTRGGRQLWNGDVSSTRWAFSETRSFAETASSRVASFLSQFSVPLTP